MDAAKKTRLTVGNYIADIVVRTANAGTEYVYVIQRSGSTEILDTGTFPTAEEARESAQAALYDLARRDLQSKGQAKA